MMHRKLFSTLFLLATIALIFDSCSSDNDNDPITDGTKLIPVTITTTTASDGNTSTINKTTTMLSYDDANRITEVLKTNLYADNTEFKQKFTINYNDDGKVSEVLQTTLNDGSYSLDRRYRYINNTIEVTTNEVLLETILLNDNQTIARREQQTITLSIPREVITTVYEYNANFANCISKIKQEEVALTTEYREFGNSKKGMFSDANVPQWLIVTLLGITNGYEKMAKQEWTSAPGSELAIWAYYSTEYNAGRYPVKINQTLLQKPYGISPTTTTIDYVKAR